MKSYRIMIFVIAGTALLASCKKLTYDLQDRSSGPYPVILAKNIESFKLMRMNGTLAYRLSGKITELTYEHKVRITPDELQKHLLDQMVVPAEVDLAGVECGAHRWAGRLPKIKKSLTGYDRITTVLPAVGIAVQVDISDGQRSFSYDGCTDEQGRDDISDDDLIEMYLKRFRSFPTRLVVESSARSPYPPMRLHASKLKTLVRQFTDYIGQLNADGPSIPIEEIVSWTHEISPPVLPAKAEALIMNHLGNTAYTKQFAETYRTPVAAVLRADTGQHPMRDYASALTVLQKYRNEIPADMHNQLLEYYVFKLEPLYFDQIAQGNTEYIKLYRKHIKNNEFAMRYAEVKGMQKKTAMQAWETRLNAAVKRGKSGQGYDELKTIITMCPHPSIVVRATNQYYAITPKVRTHKALFLDYVPIHQAADFSATVLRRDSFDKEYVVLGKVGEFYRIELDLNSVGYIHHEFIKEHERQ